jgi:hypothetical protein
MPPATGPTTNAPHDLAGLSAPNTLQPDCDPVFSDLAQGHAALIAHLRGMFFQESYQPFGTALSDGAILGLGAALYATENDPLRSQLVRANREEGRPLLDLGPLADELLDRQRLLAPKSWDDLPEPLRTIECAIAERSCDPAFTVMALERPVLVAQLRGMFFDADFSDESTALSDGAILGIAAALYAKSGDALRRQLVGPYRNEGLRLGSFANELLDRQRRLTPRRWDDLPERLRLIDQALSVLPGEDLLLNPMVGGCALDAPDDAQYEYLDQRMTTKIVAAAIAAPNSRLARAVAQDGRLFTWVG